MVRKQSLSKSRYYLLSRQKAVGRLRSSARRGSRLARKAYAGIRQRAWKNLRKLRSGLAARALLRKAMRRRARKLGRYRPSYHIAYKYGRQTVWKYNKRKR